MSDKDSLFYFMDGLQNWAKTELKRRGVQDLATAIATAESLIDYSIPKETTKKRDQRKATSEDEGEESPRERGDNHRRDFSRSKEKGKETSTKPAPRGGCFICGGPHWTRECPKKKVLNALAANLEESSSHDGHVGTLQLLNALHSTPKSPAKGLMYVNARIKGKEVRALVDTGASHNFISLDEAKRLKLNTTQRKGSIKAVNSTAKPIQGMAQRVETTIGSWTGHLDLSVVPIDDFPMVLGMEFFDKVKAFLLPCANIICVVDGEKTCVIPTIRITKSDAKTLSVMQLKDDGGRIEDKNSTSLRKTKCASKDREVRRDHFPRELLKQRAQMSDGGHQRDNRQKVNTQAQDTKGSKIVVPNWEDIKKKTTKRCNSSSTNQTCQGSKAGGGVPIRKRKGTREQQPRRLSRALKKSLMNFMSWWEGHKRHSNKGDIKRTPQNTTGGTDIRPRGVQNLKTYSKRLPNWWGCWKPKETMKFQGKTLHYMRDEDITKSSGGECHTVKVDPPNITTSWRKSQA